jgi:hypothetical protein
MLPFIFPNAIVNQKEIPTAADSESPKHLQFKMVGLSQL